MAYPHSNAYNQTASTGYHHSHHAPSHSAYTAHGGAPHHGPASHNTQHYGGMPHGAVPPHNGASYHGAHSIGHAPHHGGPRPSIYGAGSQHVHGNGARPKRSKYGISSLFVPADWNLDSSKAGFANFLARIFTNIDYQYNSMDHLPMHGIGSVMGHPGGLGSHYAPSASHHSLHPAAAHAVSVVSDPHGMFSLGNMARMGMSRGHARFSSKSIPTICPRCKKRIMTLVKRRPDGVNITATAAAVICGLLFKVPKALLPLTLLPLQMTSLQPCIHYCPACNYKMGKNVRVYIPVDDIYD
ncbi:hypothetical protein IW138_002267 [Coemansia sp. RSA 986]|nr:hypothetical protein IW138_002267 [Coemansia sp. RSA 986]